MKLTDEQLKYYAELTGRTNLHTVIMARELLVARNVVEATRYMTYTLGEVSMYDLRIAKDALRNYDNAFGGKN